MPIPDPDIKSALQSFSMQKIDRYAVDQRLISEFQTTFKEWLASSQLNSVTWDESFKADLTLAVTHSLESFMIKHRARRFRLFKGEYPANQTLLQNYGLNWAWVEDAPWSTHDALIISAPFSASGDVHPKMEIALEACTKLRLPVLVDCAFFGICRGIQLDLRAPCVEVVAFSLSKAFSLGGARIGIQFSGDCAASIRLQNEWQYVNRFGAAVGVLLMRQFGPDFIPRKYESLQHDICSELDLAPSKTVIFAMGGPKQDLYHRGGGYFRLCLTPAFCQRKYGGK